MNASWVRRLTSWSSRIRSISSVLESSSNTCYLTLNRLRASSFLRRSRSTSGGLLLGAATYSYTESTESPPELPKNPVDLPNSHLSHEVNDNNILKCLFLQYWTKPSFVPSVLDPPVVRHFRREFLSVPDARRHGDRRGSERVYREHVGTSQPLRGLCPGRHGRRSRPVRAKDQTGGCS